MRIAILHSGDLKSVSLGGVDRYIKSLITFCDDGEITVFGATVTHEHKIGKQYEYEYGGKKYFYIPIIDDHKYPLSTRYMLKELSWISKLGEYDCIYAQRTEYSLPFIFSKHKNKLIEMIHGSSKYSEMFWGKKKAIVHKLIEKIAIKTARKTFIILNRKEFGVPYYKKLYHKYANRIKYGRNPIDISVCHKQDRNLCRKKLGLNQESFIILYSGRVEYKPKRVNLLPEICEKCKYIIPNIEFIVMGDGNDRRQLIDKVQRDGLEDRFLFTGYINDPEIIAMYNSSADMGINLSMFEGTCTSILEAIACGIPIVSTDVGDIREVIHDNNNGIIIPNDEKEIVELASNSIVEILNGRYQMDNSFMAYNGDNVVSALKKEILQLQNNR